MCLRDYIAIKAMAAMLQSNPKPGTHDVEAVAAEAYRVADAMLEARKPAGPGWSAPQAWQAPRYRGDEVDMIRDT
jgi:hypothetical protein